MGIGNKRGIELFEESGALLKGHFSLRNQRDALIYIAKDLLCKNNSKALEEICLGIAQDFVLYSIGTVVGLESGAVKYARLAAESLSRLTDAKVVSVSARKTVDGKFYIDEKDPKHVKGKRVLVIEDVITTGKSVSEVIALLRSLDALVNWVGGVWNRGGVTAQKLKIGVLISQINEQYPTYQPGENCPGCKAKIPYDLKFGHGKHLGEN